MGLYGSGPKPVLYLFVDAGHLRPNFARAMSAWCGRTVELDFRKLSGLFSAHKMFFYDCLDDSLHPKETNEQHAARVRLLEAEFRRINALSNTHVRLGSITGAGKKRRQKEVDILIAVDMLNHAVRQNMDRAVLLTGDRDFTPLVEALVQFGLIVDVAGDLQATSDILAAAADNYRPLSIRAYHHLLTDRDQKAAPALPSFSSGNGHHPDERPIAQGLAGEYECALLPAAADRVDLVMKTPDRSMFTTVKRSDVGQLKVFVTFEYLGDWTWLPDSL